MNDILIAAWCIAVGVVDWESAVALLKLSMLCCHWIRHVELLDLKSFW